MAWAARACGAHGISVEVHPNPDQALSDGDQSLDFPGSRPSWKASAACACRIALRSLHQGESEGHGPAHFMQLARESEATRGPILLWATVCRWSQLIAQSLGMPSALPNSTSLGMSAPWT